jgi:subtilisin family serine protease
VRRSLFPPAVSALLLASLFVPPSLAGVHGRAPEQASEARIFKGHAHQARGTFAPGEVLVKFRASVSRARENAVHGALSARVIQRIGGGLDIQHVRLPRGLAVSEAVRRYMANPAVEYAEPNYYRFPTFTPNDTSYTDLWAFNNTGQPHPISDPPPVTAMGTSDADMDVQEGWDTEKGDPAVVIAVIDSGVDVAHTDLAGNLWHNPGEFGGTPGVDDDGNLKVDDIYGWDTAENDNVLLGPATAFGYDHGTHVSGTIAAVTNNAAGVSGVCGGDAGATQPGCAIMVLKFMDDFDTDGDGIPDAMFGTLAAELAAIAYARAEGAHVINGSYGGAPWSNSEREAFRLAGENSDILAVLAAGNDSLDNDMSLAVDLNGDDFPDVFSPAYPASYNLRHILAVAASNHHDEYGYFTGCEDAGFEKWQCAFSSFGRYSVDVAAPGVDILSTVPGDLYETFNGTSMATPNTAGVAGLLLSEDMARTALALKSIIMHTADKTTSGGAPLPLNTTMNTFLAPTGVATGTFTRTGARVNANDALTFSGTPANGSAGHDGDIPRAKAMTARSKTGNLAWPHDVNDVWAKRLVKNKTYRFTLVVPSGRDFDLFLLRSNAKEIWQPGSFLRASIRPAGADETFTYKPGSTKTFFIHLSWWLEGGKSGPYTLRVVCIRNC